ncbi:TPM domain-containing protein [Candidatus Gracilibacteria bacterium]|nr:TPM domain-containing protein [Candidatus Gracilibacteria bacterium]MCF7819622.1 TPM domain-containing protein [Candidatus Gracilibacteria bacterium]
MKKLLFCFGFLVLFLGQIFLTRAQEIPDFEDEVIDLAEIFSSEQELALEQKIRDIQSQTTAEIAILTVDSTDGQDPSRYATDIAHEWGVGKADTDNGVFILIAPEDRAWHIATGYGVEGILPDIRVKQIGEKNFPDAFRAGNYFTGVQGALRDIEGFLSQDESIISQYNNTSSEEAVKSVFSLFPVVFLILFIAPFFRKWVRQDKKKKTKRALLLSGGVAVVWAVILFFLTFFLFWAIIGGAFVFLLFFPILLADPTTHRGGPFGGGGFGSGGFGSGGGFGGFGGGGFGGGGGGGRW